VLPPVVVWEPALTEAFDASPLIRKLETILVLSDDEKNALQSIGGTVKTLDARQDIVREGDRPSACCLLLEGFLCRYKLTHDGKRQIISFHIPGEIPRSPEPASGCHGPQHGHAGPKQDGHTLMGQARSRSSERLRILDCGPWLVGCAALIREAISQIVPQTGYDAAFQVPYVPHGT
jgi:hypothetical protein